MGGEFTCQPKWDPIGFDPQPYSAQVVFITAPAAAGPEALPALRIKQETRRSMLGSDSSQDSVLQSLFSGIEWKPTWSWVKTNGTILE